MTGRCHNDMTGRCHNYMTGRCHNYMTGRCHKCMTWRCHNYMTGRCHNYMTGRCHNYMTGRCHKCMTGRCHNFMTGRCHNYMTGRCHDYMTGRCHNYMTAAGRLAPVRHNKRRAPCESRHVVGRMPRANPIFLKKYKRSWSTPTADAEGPVPIGGHPETRLAETFPTGTKEDARRPLGVRRRRAPKGQSRKDPAKTSGLHSLLLSRWPAARMCSISALSRRRRRHVHCAGMDVLVPKTTASARRSF